MPAQKPSPSSPTAALLPEPLRDNPIYQHLFGKTEGKSTQASQHQQGKYSLQASNSGARGSPVSQVTGRGTL